VQRWVDIKSLGLFPFPRGLPAKDCVEDKMGRVEFEAADVCTAFVVPGNAVRI